MLGPLVVAGICVAEEDLPGLWELGARDSKRVPRGKRCALVRAIARSGVRARAVVVPAAAVNQENLTSLERDAALRIASILSPDRIVMDTPVGPRAIPQFRDSLSVRSGLPRRGSRWSPRRTATTRPSRRPRSWRRWCGMGTWSPYTASSGTSGGATPGSLRSSGTSLRGWPMREPSPRSAAPGGDVSRSSLRRTPELHPSRIQGRMGEIAVRG